MFVLQKMMRRQNADDPEQISVNGSLRFVTMIVTMPIMMIIIFMSWNLYLLRMMLIVLMLIINQVE